MTSRKAASGHEPAPQPDTAYTADGPYALQKVDERIARAFPATAHCSCGEILSRASQGEPWVHTGRKPGED
jgi:hypothetical protein